MLNGNSNAHLLPSKQQSEASEGKPPSPTTPVFLNPMNGLNMMRRASCMVSEVSKLKKPCTKKVEIGKSILGKVCLWRYTLVLIMLILKKICSCLISK